MHFLFMRVKNSCITHAFKSIQDFLKEILTKSINIWCSIYLLPFFFIFLENRKQSLKHSLSMFKIFSFSNNKSNNILGFALLVLKY